MDPARAAAWLAHAAAGKTRTRNSLYGPAAAAYSNSMRVRIDTYNAFAEFLGRPDRLDSQAPAGGFLLTPADTERLLHDLSVRRPVHANAATALRTAAVAALVADTGRGVPELARLRLGALHLDGAARVELGDESCPLGGATVQILNRWLLARAEIIAELEGSDPGHLWIPTKPGRPRGGNPPVKPGLTRAAVRTLHAAHRSLVSQVLGTPLRPGAFRVPAQARSRGGEG
jgi:integrase